MSSTQVILTVVVIVVLVAAAAAAWVLMRRNALRKRFGPEYDKVMSESDGRLAAERELRARERRHNELNIRPLSAQARQRYSAEWEEVQAQFIDWPAEAVRTGDELVTRLVAERGYPAHDFEERLADLSVEHAHTLAQYREAHDIAERDRRGEATTEQLRQAMMHYRALFVDLIGPGNVGPSNPDNGSGPAGTNADTPRQATNR
jgi:hypothetical protein